MGPSYERKSDLSAAHYTHPILIGKVGLEGEEREGEGVAAPDSDLSLELFVFWPSLSLQYVLNLLYLSVRKVDQALL